MKKKYFQDSFDEAVTICKEEIKTCLFLQDSQAIDLNRDLVSAVVAINLMKRFLLSKSILTRKSTIDENLLVEYKQLFLAGLKGLMKITGKRIQTIIDDLEKLMIRKQKDYGKANIMLFEHIGIMVRVSDKLERLKNLFISGRSPQNESILDSYKDVTNYALIGIMVLSGTFLRDLKNEE